MTNLTETASQAINALKGQPLLLVVVLLNALMLGMLYYVGAAQREERATLTKYLIDCQRQP